MSTEQGEGSSSQKAASQRSNPERRTTPITDLATSQQQQEQREKLPGPLQQQHQSEVQSAAAAATTPPPPPSRRGHEEGTTTAARAQVGASVPPDTAQSSATTAEDRKPSASRPDHPSQSTSPSTPEDQAAGRPRQVIAVSASKGPAAFFNLARKFLVTDEMCDLSALEGAIVSAVDAAHLLERSKLATIVRVQTSYVTVEPKRRKQPPGSSLQQQQPLIQPGGMGVSSPVAAGVVQQQQLYAAPTMQPGDGLPSQQSTVRRSSAGRELRRARIVITVRRTESYRQWLEDNPLQAIIAGDAGDVEEEEEEATRGKVQD